MDLRVTQDQRDISASVGTVLHRYRRQAIDDAGAGPIEAAFVLEAIGASAVAAPLAGRVLVAPALGLKDLPAAVALVPSLTGALSRHAPSAQAFLAIDGDEAVVAMADTCSVESVTSRYGVPLGRVTVGDTVQRLGAGSAARLRAAWRVALAAEAAGAMLAAIEHTSRYVTERVQFGRSIGSFQAVQHQLAEVYILAEGARWLARRAAIAPEDGYLAASSAAFACTATARTYTVTQQVSGATGITTEHGLVAWTMPLIAAQTELGGVRAHAQDVARGRLARRAIGTES
jgi:alkylation response protein AidB-like acyl-CoA dehydrogenase